MAKFTVKVQGMSIKGNKVATFGQVVDENQLCSSSDELVRAGFIDQLDVNSEVSEDAFELDKMTKAQLIDFAKANDFKVTETATKAVILSEIESQTSDVSVPE